MCMCTSVLKTKAEKGDKRARESNKGDGERRKMTDKDRKEKMLHGRRQTHTH